MSEYKEVFDKTQSGAMHIYDKVVNYYRGKKFVLTMKDEALIDLEIDGEMYLANKVVAEVDTQLLSLVLWREGIAAKSLF